MTCPVSHQQIDPMTASLRPEADGSAADVVDRMEDICGSTFTALFSAALFDQAMHPEVSAALEKTGRIREQPFGRAARTAASEQILLVGDDADRRTESERLIRLHRDVKGTSPEGIRYSAFNPETWNLIIISTFFMHQAAYEALTGHKLTSSENQAIWDWFRGRFGGGGLELPGRSRLIEDYEDLCVYYDQLAVEKLECTDTLEVAVAHLFSGVGPDSLPAVVAPLWRAAGPVIGHVAAVLGFGSMRPAARAHIPMDWTSRHDVEYAILTRLLRVSYQWLPARLTQTPLARNRREYQRLMASHRDLGLSSFLPDSEVAAG